MFGIGFWELILIFVVALIIFGPEKLPKIATSLGKAYYEFRKTFEEVKFDIENEVQDIDQTSAIEETTNQEVETQEEATNTNTEDEKGGMDQGNKEADSASKDKENNSFSYNHSSTSDNTEKTETRDQDESIEPGENGGKKSDKSE